MIAFRRPCADHRAILFAWVDRRAVDRRTPAALAHLDRCSECDREMAGVALAIVALRRMQLELAGVEPPADAWLRLRDRVTRRGDPWRWRATLGGMATSAMLVGVLVLPATVGGPAAGSPSPDLPSALAELRYESAYLARSRSGNLPASPRADRSSASVPRTYPDEIAQVRKEVTSAKPVRRPPEPI